MGPKNEFTRLYRGLRRRINRGRPLDSYPFLSGDSFFFSCQYYYESGLVRRVPTRQGRIQKDNSLFVRIGELVGFIQFLEGIQVEKFLDTALVLHNGDDNIPEYVLSFLTSRFRKIFAVNLLKESKNYTRPA